MRHYVMAVDPGVTTGLVVHGPPNFFYVRERNFEEMVDEVRANADALKAIVCERYTITAETLRKTRQSASLELIGFLRATAYEEGIPLVLQAPGDAKRFATDNRLRTAGWFQPGKDHANDALRHLMLYLVKTGQMEPPR